MIRRRWAAWPAVVAAAGLLVVSALALTSCGASSDTGTRPARDHRAPAASAQLLDAARPFTPADADLAFAISASRAPEGPWGRFDAVLARLPAYAPMRDRIDTPDLIMRAMQQLVGVPRAAPDRAVAAPSHAMLGDVCGGARWLGHGRSAPRWMLWCELRADRSDIDAYVERLQRRAREQGERVAMIDGRMVVTSDPRTLSAVRRVSGGGGDAGDASIERSSVWKQVRQDRVSSNARATRDLMQIYVASPRELATAYAEADTRLSRMLSPMRPLERPVAVRAGTDAAGLWIIATSGIGDAGDADDAGDAAAPPLKQSAARLLGSLPSSTIVGVAQQGRAPNDPLAAFAAGAMLRLASAPNALTFLDAAADRPNTYALIDDRQSLALVAARGMPGPRGDAAPAGSIDAIAATATGRLTAQREMITSWVRGVNSLRGLDRLEHELAAAGVARSAQSVAWADAQSLARIAVRGLRLSSTERDVAAGQFSAAIGPIGWTQRDASWQTTRLRLLLEN